MQISLKHNKDHLSITAFNDTPIPDFVVLTGVNGAGKTHLLKAIENGDVQLAGLNKPRIIYFNYETFRMENESTFEARSLTTERKKAWELFIEPQNANFKGHVLSYKSNLGSSYQELATIAQAKQKSLWQLEVTDVNDKALYEKLQNYRNSVEEYVRNNNHLKSNEQAKAILTLIKNFLSAWMSWDKMSLISCMNHSYSNQTSSQFN